MASKRERARDWLNKHLPWDWIAIAMVIGSVTAAGGLWRWSHEPGPSEVVVAKRDLPAYTAISAEDVTTARINPPGGSSNDVGAPVGAITTAAIKQGKAIREADLLRPAHAERGPWAILHVAAPPGPTPPKGTTVKLFGASKGDATPAKEVTESAIVLSAAANGVTLLVPAMDAGAAARYLGPDSTLVMAETLPPTSP